MIGYETPPAIRMPILVVLILTACLQAVAMLEANELLLNRRAMIWVRLHYGLLAVVSAVLSVEAVWLEASVEGGLFLPLGALLRYLVLLPLMLYLVFRILPVELEPALRPSVASVLIPLSFLPVLDHLPLLPVVVLRVFSVSWLMLDILLTLLTYRSRARTEITYDVIPRMLERIDYGLCVMNRKGWILETNPAFDSFWRQLGLPQPEHYRDIDQLLARRQQDGILQIIPEDGQLLIQSGDNFFALQRNRFKAGRRTFVQLTLSDVSNLRQAARVLEEENSRLAGKNRELAQIIEKIRREEAVRERQRLCQATHDDWSQRLAVAGLTVDMLLGDEQNPPSPQKLADIQTLLDMPADLPKPSDTGLDAALAHLTRLYEQLGVSIRATGQAVFTAPQERALIYILREAFANAVRHAYARSIDLLFFSSRQRTGVTVRNEAADASAGFLPGRGLGDMHLRAQQAGGVLQVSCDRFFTVEVTFDQNGEGNHENHPD